MAENIKDLMIHHAYQELRKWQHGGWSETHSGARASLLRYWDACGIKGNEAASNVKKRTAWSSAFLSYLAVCANAKRAFTVTSAHRVYIGAAKIARARGDSTRFWAYRIAETPLELGDIVCIDRPPDGETICFGSTYDTIDDGLIRPSHGDIVVSLDGRSAVTIGGNVGHAVGETRYDVDSTGHIRQPEGKCELIAIVRPPA